jgi:hypothetical protein
MNRPPLVRAKDAIVGSELITGKRDSMDLSDTNNTTPGGSRRRRPSRKYKKSAKRVFRKKSRSTRRR